MWKKTRGGVMSYEAEKAVIGSLLIDNNAIASIYSLIEPNMFTDALLGKIYYEIRQGYDLGRNTDVITLKESLTVENIPEESITNAIMECMDSSVTSLNISEYAEIVARDYRAKVVDNILSLNKVTSSNVDTLIGELTKTLESIQVVDNEGVMTISQAVDEYAEKRFKPDREQGIPTGYKALDNILQGLDGGDMCIIAARPGVGKSAISTEIAINIAKTKKRVVLFNLEMSTEQIYDRILSHESGISLKRIRRALNFLGDEKEQFDRGNKTLKDLGDSLIIIDNIHKVSDMQSILRKNKADIAVIDYAQLIVPESNYKGNRYAEVGAISHSIKRMAKRLKIPIVLLAQLNRVSQQSKDKEPTMSELREAGDFEQDASQIILVWDKSEDRKLKGIKVDKNRQGEVGKVLMKFNGDNMSFEETDGEYEDAEETPFD